MADLTRKAFLGLGATAVGLGAFGGVANALGTSDDVLRPPMVPDEAEFASKCIRCYRCIETCHTHALVVATVEDGILAMRTPKFDFHKGSCDFCNQCIDVCPTDAIVPADPYRPASGRIGIAVVQPDRCVAYFNGCRKCAEECPYGAISLDESGYPVVHEAACNGCGVCENVCPALVLRSFSGGKRRGIVIVKNEAQALKMKESFEGSGDGNA